MMIEKIENFQPPWLTIAKGELGQVEIPGPQDNPRIVEYHHETSLRAGDDETPWCSAFVNWCMRRSGLPGTNSAAARSWLRWGKEIRIPAFGCVTILRRGRSWQGHVGFFVGQRNGKISVLGGNQSNSVSIASYSENRLLGYRWPA